MRISVSKIRKTFAFALLAFASAISAEVGDLKAYPNPFSPDKEYLKIARKDNANLPAGEIQLVVYDYSLREVYRKQGNGGGANIEWAGIDDTGRKVVPGLYFIKVIHIGTTAGDVSEKMLKVLVR